MLYDNEKVIVIYPFPELASEIHVAFKGTKLEPPPPPPPPIGPPPLKQSLPPPPPP